MSCLSALEKFLSEYQQAYREKLGEAPRFYAQGEASECLIIGEASSEREEDPVLWKAVNRSEPANFDNVAHALSLTLHPDINAFYGTKFAAPVLFDSDFGEGELLQVWNQQDFEYLQQNIIGHLMMKAKLKQEPTWFIGVLGDGDMMITVNNDTGAVYQETPGEEQTQKLADSLEAFLENIRPRVAPAVAPIEEPILDTQHQGLTARLKRMWHSLLGR